MNKPKHLREIKVSWLGCAGARPSRPYVQNLLFLVCFLVSGTLVPIFKIKGNCIGRELGIFEKKCRRMIVEIRTC